MPSYCEVALPVPLDHTFTYGVRPGQSPQRGARVIVPFRNEKLIGVVTALATKAPPDFEVRYLEAVLDEEPLLSEHLLELGAWAAQYYLAPLGEVLRAMLPLAAEVRRTVYYRITDLGRDTLATAMEESAHQIPPTKPAAVVTRGSIQGRLMWNEYGLIPPSPPGSGGMYPTRVPSTKCLTKLMHQISANAPRPAPAPIRIPMNPHFRR